MKQIKEEIFLEIAKRLEVEKIKRQNTVEVCFFKRMYCNQMKF